MHPLQPRTRPHPPTWASGGSPCPDAPPVPATDPCPASLRVLVLQRGRALEWTGGFVVYDLGSAWFAVERGTGEMTGPYPDVASLFSLRGRVLASGPGGELLEWDEMVVSRACDGEVAGPYPHVDEWIWAQGEIVFQEQGPTGSCLSTGGRFIHHWRGHYFVTVDPLPVSGYAFPTLEQARGALRALSFLTARLSRG
ncbi:MAG: hypothetical protein RQ751_11920 [Longimicrobiales bacterium]|nr:hypothetical protein [Longimicrobiales bacterium]